jgi:hypothetical protein
MSEEKFAAPCSPPKFSVIYGGASGHAHFSDSSDPLMDLSIPPGQVAPESWNYRAWVAIPVDVPDQVSVLAFVKTVNGKLAGRDPVTYVRPANDAVVTNFAVYDVGDRCRHEVDAFATSLNKLLHPMAVSAPNIYYKFAGEPVEDLSSH